MDALKELIRPLSKNTALIAFIVGVASVITLAISNPEVCAASSTDSMHALACWIVAHVPKGWLATVAIIASILKLLSHSLTGTGGKPAP